MDVLTRLRAVIVGRLSQLSDAADQPPMHALRALYDAEAIDKETFENLEYAITVTSETLYDNPVDKDEVSRAIEAAAWAFNRLNRDAQDVSRQPDDVLVFKHYRGIAGESPQPGSQKNAQYPVGKVRF